MVAEATLVGAAAGFFTTLVALLVPAIPFTGLGVVGLAEAEAGQAFVAVGLVVAAGRTEPIFDTAELMAGVRVMRLAVELLGAGDGLVGPGRVVVDVAGLVAATLDVVLVKDFLMGAGLASAGLAVVVRCE